MFVLVRRTRNFVILLHLYQLMISLNMPYCLPIFLSVTLPCIIENLDGEQFFMVLLTLILGHFAY